MNYTPPPPTAAASLISFSSGTIISANLDQLATNPVILLPNLSENQFYTIFSITIQANAKTAATTMNGPYITARPLSTSTAEAFAQLDFSQNGEPGFSGYTQVQGGNSGLFSINYHTQNNLMPGEGVKLTQLFNETLSVGIDGHYFIYYAITDIIP